MHDDAVPVTILSGMLGAGKTTLLNHLLRHADRDLAVLVNDMGDVNVDADLVSENSEFAAGGVAELSNGCICCELRGDLETAVVRLARERDFDHLVVEASGISEPEPVARLFTRGSSAAAVYDVDSVVAVVDTRAFHDAFAGDGEVVRRGEGEDGTKPLSDLLVEGVEFADLVLLNKADLVSDEELATVNELVAALRPDAEVVVTEFSEVDPDDLLGRGLFDPTGAAERAGWRRALDADGAEEDEAHDRAHGDDHADDHDGHSHPQEAYGVTSFTYRRREPFHPGRLHEFLASLPDSVVRSKGTLWVAGNEQRLSYSQAGPSVRVEGAGPWIASLPEVDQELYRSNRRNVQWDEEVGDRLAELVFIGRGMDESALVEALDDCLLAAAADPEAVGDDPFPSEPEAEYVVREPGAGEE
ncbi:CobW family GTP-binding protein [Halobium salinum]|uniref:CobW family GTP-binding protein n=1 Tax=Halobium salinum TaxID=1364940 RepID=A0ABD5PGD1_9EURY|nr:GTP-binding protein [Halobium salinum]